MFAYSVYSFANRLTHIKENHKFQKNGREGHREDNPANGLAHIVTEIKRKYELKYGAILLFQIFFCSYIL